MTRRYLSRTDSLQQDIVAALRKAGAQVWLTHSVGGGFPDTIVCIGGECLYLLEIKTPHGTLTPQQTMFNAKWPVHIIRSVEDAVKFVNQLAEESPK